MIVFVFVNGETHQFDENLTLKDCLIQLGYTDETPVATAVNEIFIPCGHRGDIMLQNGDRIEILSAMQGG